VPGIGLLSQPIKRGFRHSFGDGESRAYTMKTKSKNPA
jgi:hypothetical protein